MKTAVKFCGGCNPEIDRGRVCRELRKNISRGMIFDSGTDSYCDSGILICGCSSACADTPELRKRAGRWIVIGGKSINGIAVEESALAGLVASMLRDWFKLEGSESCES